tara:strand:+ start:219 stop:491 length:273 start_codon:yes stop_codon:yes gene_type:complete
MIETLSEIMADLGKQQESIILDQLNDLVKRGLLVVESTQPVLVRNYNQDKITVQQSIRLTLKDKEYIEKLEKENSEYKDLIERLNKALER